MKMLNGMTIKASGVVVGNVKRHLSGPRLQWDFAYRVELPTVVIGNKYARKLHEIRQIIIGMYPDAQFEYNHVKAARRRAA
jgi:hypothetical protein